MNGKPNPLRRDLIVALAVLLGIAGLGAAAVFWLDPEASDRWAMLAAFSELLAAAAIFSGFYLNYRSRVNATRIENLELAARLIERLNHPDHIDARTWVYQRLPRPYNHLGTREKDYIKLVLNSLDEIALYFQISQLEDEAVMRYINPMVVKCWARLKPFVYEQREARGEPDYYVDAEQFAERCIAWREARYGSAEITWLDPRQAL